MADCSPFSLASQTCGIQMQYGNTYLISSKCAQTDISHNTLNQVFALLPCSLINLFTALIIINNYFECLGGIREAKIEGFA